MDDYEFDLPNVVLNSKCGLGADDYCTVKTAINYLTYCVVELAFAVGAQAQSSSFTYQARLAASGAPFTGFAEMNFVLFDAATDGTAVATNALAPASVNVSNGLFAVTLDFGAGIFDGADRFLEIQVRTNNSAFVTLAPRQQLSPVPTAIFAQAAGRLNGTISVTQLPANVVTNGATISGTFSGDGSQITGVDALTLNGLGTEGFWKSRGNGGTIPGTDFLGTTDNQPLEFKVGGLRALRLEPNPQGSPNVVGGSAFNYVSNSVVGATIAGGGETFVQNFTNVVTANFGAVGGGTGNRAAFVATVGGGTANVAGFDAATVSGGFNNTASGHASAIGGGGQNTAGGGEATVSGGFTNAASADFSTVGGGFSNVAGGNSATVSGGFENSATGVAATVAGGNHNVAAGDYSLAAGNSARAMHQGSFVWADDLGGFFSSTANNQFLIRAAGGVGIGTTAPQAPLHVAANTPQMRLEDTTFHNYWTIYTEALASSSASGNLLFLSKGGSFVYFDKAGVVHDASDRRLKRGISPVGPVLDRVLQLRPVSYRMRCAPDNGPATLGFIAQEVEPLFPEVVGEHDGMKSLAYSELIPVTVGAIQELNRKLEAGNRESEARIRKLETENAELNRKNEQLERRLAALEKAVLGQKRN